MARRVAAIDVALEAPKSELSGMTVFIAETQVPIPADVLVKALSQERINLQQRLAEMGIRMLPPDRGDNFPAEAGFPTDAP